MNEKPVWKKNSKKFIKEYDCWEKLIICWDFTPFKSSHRRCSVIKDAVKNVANFTGNHLCGRCVNCRCPDLQLYSKETPTQVFSCENPEIFKNTYFKEDLKKEHLPTAASCLSEAEYAYAINCYTRWNQLYISTMALPQLSCFVLCSSL